MFSSHAHIKLIQDFTPTCEKFCINMWKSLMSLGQKKLTVIRAQRLLSCSVLFPKKDEFIYIFMYAFMLRHQKIKTRKTVTHA